MTHSCSHLVIFAYVGTFIKTEKQYLHMWCCTGILWLVIIKVIISFSMTPYRFCMIYLHKAYWIYYRRMHCNFDYGEVNVFLKYPFERQILRCIVRHEITNHWYPYLNEKMRHWRNMLYELNNISHSILLIKKSYYSFYLIRYLYQL